MNAMEKFKELILGKGEVGVILESADEVVEFLKENWDPEFHKSKTTERFRGYMLCKVDLINSSTVKLEKIDTEEFMKELRATIETKFINDPEVTEFNILDNVSPILEKYPKVKPCLNKLLNKLHKTIYHKGYEMKLSDDYIYKKEFIAKYKAYIFSKNNTPYVELTPLEGTKTSYTVRSARGFKFTNNSLTFKYDRLDEIMNLNDVSSSEIVLDEKSIKRFYSFDDIFFVKPTKKKVEEWWNYDCPFLSRYETNLDYEGTMIGIIPVVFESTIIESGWNSVYVSDDILEEEVKAFTKGYENTFVYEECKRVLKVKDTTEIEKTEVLKKVEVFEKQVQSVIDDYAKEILVETIVECNPHTWFYENVEGTSKYNEVNSAIINYDGEEKLVMLREALNLLPEDNLKELLNLLEPQAFDCGFLYLKPSDENMVSLLKDASKYASGSRYLDTLNVKTPWYGQSTTIMRCLGRAISNIVDKYSNVKLTYYTVLD